MPKKNGKSPLAAAIGNYMLCMDGEKTPECYSIATTTDQAAISWRYSKLMLEDLATRFARFEDIDCNDSMHDKHIRYNGGVYKPLSFGDNERHDGLLVSFGLIDEYHAHKNNRGYKILSDGMSATDNPLLLAITTAGFDTDSACYLHREQCIRVLNGELKDESNLVIIYTTDKGDRWDKEETWIKANPNYGISISKKSFMDDLVMAREKPSDEVSFRTKKLNEWLSSATTWIPSPQIKKCIEEFEPEPYAECYGGMDLASTNDVTALSFDFVRGEQHYVKTFYYMPEQKLKDWGGETGANLRAWAEQGFIITTPGDTTDYEFVKRDLLAFNAKYEIVSIGYDPANAKQFCSDLFSNYQINMRPMNQNTSVMNAPTKMLEKLILDVNFRYDGNPVTTWMFSNVYIFMDSQERIKIIKNPDKKGVADVRNKKVDGPVSIVMAVGEATDEENVKQTWNEPFAI